METSEDNVLAVARRIHRTATGAGRIAYNGFCSLAQCAVQLEPRLLSLDEGSYNAFIGELHRHFGMAPPEVLSIQDKDWPLVA